MDPVGVDTKHPVTTERRHRAPVDFDDHAQHAQPRAFFQAGFIECPALVDDAAALAHQDIERQALFHPVVAGDNVLEHRVDGLRLGFGQKADPAQVDAQHRDAGVAGQLGRPQEGAVATEDQHQLAALGGVGLGVDHLDFDAHCPHVVGSQRAAIPCRPLRRRAPEAKFRCRPALSARAVRSRWRLRARCARPAGSSRLITHCGPSLHRALHRIHQSVAGQCPIGLGPQPQEVLDIARRARQRAGCDVDGMPAQLAGTPATASTDSARNAGS